MLFDFYSVRKFTKFINYVLQEAMIFTNVYNINFDSLHLSITIYVGIIGYKRSIKLAFFNSYQQPSKLGGKN
jgi:hypothetical protein